MLLFIDTETTGLIDSSLPLSHERQPHIVQLAAWLGEWKALGPYEYMMYLENVATLNAVIRPDGWTIPERATAIHGITTDYALAFGEALPAVLGRLIDLASQADSPLGSGLLIAHNFSFDHQMLLAEFERLDFTPMPLELLRPFCTMRALTPRMRLPGRHPGQFKWPSLLEAHKFCFPASDGFDNAHTAMGDVLACKDVYLKGRREGWWQ